MCRLFSNRLRNPASHSGGGGEYFCRERKKARKKSDTSASLTLKIYREGGGGAQCQAWLKYKFQIQKNHVFLSFRIQVLRLGLSALCDLWLGLSVLCDFWLGLSDLYYWLLTRKKVRHVQYICRNSTIESMITVKPVYTLHIIVNHIEPQGHPNEYGGGGEGGEYSCSCTVYTRWPFSYVVQHVTVTCCS